MKERILEILKDNKLTKLELYKILGVDICQTSEIDALLEQMIEDDEIVYKHNFYKIAKKKEINEHYVYELIKNNLFVDYNYLLKKTKLDKETLDNYLQNLLASDKICYNKKYGYGKKIEAKVIIRGNKVVAFSTFNDKRYKIINAKWRNFLSGDIADIVPVSYDEAMIFDIKEHRTANITGTVKIRKKKNTYYLIPRDRDIDIIDINLRDLNGAKPDDIVYVSLIYKSRITAKVEKIIGKRDDKFIEYFEVAYHYGFDNIFPDDVKKELNDIPNEVNPKDLLDRKDYTNLDVITIDGDDSKDFDDAISVIKHDKGYSLYVFIADVAHYVKENSPLDIEALKRGTSVYFANQVIPMLPVELSNGICSLNENVIRLVMALEIELDKNGELLSYEIKEGYIKSKHRMTYNKVNKILCGDEALINEYNDIYKMLMDSNELAKKIRGIRHKKGALDFLSTEYGFDINADGEVLNVHKRVTGDAEKLIEDFMLEANYVVAYHMNLLNLPIVYRVHETPDVEKMAVALQEIKDMGIKVKNIQNAIHPKELQKILEEDNDLDNREIISNILLKSMQKAYYSGECLGHYALQLEYYCHFTSPIRRYPDLMTHRMIKKLLLHPTNLDEDIAKYSTLINTISKQNSESEQKATKVEWDVEDILFGKLAQKMIGKTYVGKIVSITDFGVFIKLENGVEGLISYRDMDAYYDLGDKFINSFKLGDELEVVLFEVDDKYRVNFVLKEDYDGFNEEYMY